MYQIIAYIKFLLQSTNQHGVHSPFVFKLVTKCFYDTTPKKTYLNIKAYRNNLLNNHNKIQITDYGKGSKVFKTNTRSISQIAKVSGSKYKRLQLLTRFVEFNAPNKILELGTSLGLSTYAMTLGNPKAEITTVEGCKNSAQFTTLEFKELNLNHIQIVNQNFDSFLKDISSHYDLIFIDGNHQKEATIGYFEQLLKNIHNNSVMIFDDIYWSKEMTQAWDYIKQNKKVSVTIDTFFWGFVFFRKEQNKQDFKIRVR